MIGLEGLLDRLENVHRGVGDGQYSARCPAHEDRGPSLRIKQKPDGALLLNCRAGCPTSSVLFAAGLKMGDLFPPRTPAEAKVAKQRAAQHHTQKDIERELLVLVLLEGKSAPSEMTRREQAVLKLRQMGVWRKGRTWVSILMEIDEFFAEMMYARSQPLEAANT